MRYAFFVLRNLVRKKKPGFFTKPGFWLAEFRTLPEADHAG